MHIPKRNFLEKLATQLSEGLPSHLSAGKKEVKQLLQTKLKTAFSKLNLVTDEEFKVQTKVLGRARTKLDELEKRLQELEHSLHKKHRK